MSVTRLLVLGAVRIFQPTHGYFVRRELGTWQVAEWANLHPGSVYNALRGLTKEQMLVEGDEAPSKPEARGGGPRTTYRLTVDGEQEFLRLVRVALWELHPYEPAWLMAGISFWGKLQRDEVIAALETRANLLAARIEGGRFATRALREHAEGTPEHIVESFDFQNGQITAERAWALAAAERIRAGAYGFQGEDPAHQGPALDPFRPPRPPDRLIKFD